MAMNDDSHYMQRCIQLAKLGVGKVAPNPMVAAVLVFENRIIGEGFHQLYGQAHAEVHCIRNAEMYEDRKSLLPKSTLYVSLEPCAHFGKTPPCADLVIAKKIPRVVIGCRDPFEQVNGKGIERLQQAGIEVIAGVLEDECKQLNERFFTFHLKKRPFIVLKWSQTANSKIAGPKGSRSFISNQLSNRLVHKWRSEEASILVGTDTALNDDPSLTNRLWSGKNPVRIVLDRNLRLPESLRLFDGQESTIVFNLLKHEEKQNLLFFKLSNDSNFLEQVMKALFELNIQSVFVEGGAKMLQSFIDQNLWDEARIITNQQLRLDEGINAPAFSGALLKESIRLQSDTISFFRPLNVEAKV